MPRCWKAAREGSEGTLLPCFEDHRWASAGAELGEGAVSVTLGEASRCQAADRAPAFLGAKLGPGSTPEGDRGELQGRTEASPRPWSRPRAPPEWSSRVCRKVPSRPGSAETTLGVPTPPPPLPRDPPAAPAPSPALACLSGTAHPPSLPTEACGLRVQPQPTGQRGGRISCLVALGSRERGWAGESCQSQPLIEANTAKKEKGQHLPVGKSMKFYSIIFN